MHCNCKHGYVIEHKDSKIAPIKCKTVVEVKRCADELRTNDPEGMKRGEYIVTEMSYYFEPPKENQ